MDIIVCMKQVPDPESSRECFVIDTEKLRVEPRGIPPVLSPFDENALEAALRIKGDLQDRDVKITVVSVGRKISSAILQKALAVGADELVKVEDDAFESGALDSYATASVLAATMKRIGRYDLILAGRQAADWNAGQVGVGVAHLLGIPVVTLARRVDVDGTNTVVERLTGDGYERVRAPLPALVVVSNEVGELRYPGIAQRKAARSKPVVAWTAADVGFGTLPRRRLRLVELTSPEVRATDCILVDGADGADAGRRLAERLHRDGVL